MTDKIEVEKLAVIKERENRDLDTLVNENTLVAGETGAGVFGVFKFFQGIRNFFKGIQALGTLVTTSKIPVLQDDGSLKFTTPADITSGLATTTELNNALANLNNIPIDSTAYAQTSGNFDEIKEVTYGVKYFWIRYGADFTNTPMNNADWIILELIGTSSFRLTQRAYCQKVGKRTEIYERSLVNSTSSGGSWTSWEKLTTETDLNNALVEYPTKTETDSKIEAALVEYPTKTETDSKIEAALSNIPKVSVSDSEGIELYAHRGMSNLAPDCSFESWEWARRLGFYGIEIDIQETSDHVMVCWHDDTLDALTNGTGTVASKTWAQLKALYYDAGNCIASYPNLRISRLEELLAYAKKYSMHVLLDVKTISSFTTLAQKIVEYDVVSLVRVCCGTEAEITAIRAVNEFIPLRFWDKEPVPTFNDLVDVAKKYNDCDISLSYTDVTSAIVTYAHTNKVKIATYPNDIVPEPNYVYTYLMNLGVDRATVNTITNSNDFSKVECNRHARFPSAEGGHLNIYGYGSLTAGTKAQAYSTSGKYYVDDNIAVIHCNTSVSGAIQQAFYANKGDVIKITTHSRITSSSSVDDDTSREQHLLGFFTATEQASVTDVTLDESATYILGNPIGKGFGASAGYSYDDIHNWQTYETYYIAKQSGLYCASVGLHGSASSGYNSYIYECSNFMVEVYGTGGASAKSRKNWNFIKGFPYASKVLSCKLHRSVMTMGRITVEYEWDGLNIKADVGNKTATVWSDPTTFGSVYSMCIKPSIDFENYGTNLKRISLTTSHKEGQIGGSGFTTSSLGITGIFCEI